MVFTRAGKRTKQKIVQKVTPVMPHGGCTTSHPLQYTLERVLVLPSGTGSSAGKVI